MNETQLPLYYVLSAYVRTRICLHIPCFYLKSTQSELLMYTPMLIQRQQSKCDVVSRLYKRVLESGSVKFSPGRLTNMTYGQSCEVYRRKVFNFVMGKKIMKMMQMMMTVIITIMIITLFRVRSLIYGTRQESGRTMAIK